MGGYKINDLKKNSAKKLKDNIQVLNTGLKETGELLRVKNFIKMILLTYGDSLQV